VGFVILDTTFIIDFHREISRRAPGAAAGFLAGIRNEPLHISIITMGEFIEGVAPGQLAAGCAFIEQFGIFPLDRAVALTYAEVSRSLRAAGARIGDNDLWIGATALAHEQRLVTRNASHFRRLKHLQILTY
jgi:tRNA(fMet)-specific endonuclease VapC